MKAMIFAAGMGTRLQPLTLHTPKALVEIQGKTLLEICICKLIKYGFDDIIINVHHLSEQITRFLNEKNNFGINIMLSDESEQLLETGGGIKKAAWFFDDNNPFLVHNVDVISDINLGEIYREHLASGAIATLAVRNRKTSRYFLFDSKQQLCGWKNVTTGEKIIQNKTIKELTPMAFSGIQVISPSIFKEIKEEGAFSIKDIYLRLCSKHPIRGFTHQDGLWMDIGKQEALEEANRIL